MILEAALLVVLHTLDNHPVYINPAQVVSIGEPRIDSKVLSRAGKCLLTFSNGKLLTVLEPCDVVRERLEEVKKELPK